MNFAPDEVDCAICEKFCGHWFCIECNRRFCDDCVVPVSEDGKSGTALCLGCNVEG